MLAANGQVAVAGLLLDACGLEAADYIYKFCCPGTGPDAASRYIGTHLDVAQCAYEEEASDGFYAILRLSRMRYRSRISRSFEPTPRATNR